MFNTLPPEIIHLIAHDLGSKDLSHLVSSSRQLHTVLQQSLYTNVTLYAQESRDQNVNIFLYAVTQTPKLASYVRSLAVRCWDVDNAIYERHDQKVGFDGNIVRRLVGERTGYSEEERSKWLKDLERDNSDAWLALLIPQLKELRKLSPVWPSGPYYVLDMLQKAAIEEPLFPHLADVYAAWHDSEDAVPSHYMHPFFKFPSVRKLGCYMLAEYENREDDDFEPESDDEDPKRDTLPPRCSNIADIDLLEINAGEGMREWVQACNALKSFRIAHGAGVVSWDDFCPRKLYDSLSLQKQTLESVWIEAKGGVHLNGDDEWMGSFVDFTALRLICASLPNLVGVDERDLAVRKLRDVLPSSLEALYLSVDDSVYKGDRFNEAIDQLGELTALESFPKLAAIHLEYFPRKPENAGRLEWLKQKCEDAGVLYLPHNSQEWVQGEKQMNGLIWPCNEAILLDYQDWELRRREYLSTDVSRPTFPHSIHTVE